MRFFCGNRDRSLVRVIPLLRRGIAKIPCPAYFPSCSLLSVMHCFGSQSCSPHGGHGSILGYNLTSILQIETEFKTRWFYCIANMGLFHFLLACMSFNQLPEVHLCVRSHRHPRNNPHHVIYLFEDISSLDAANSTVVGGRHCRDQYSQAKREEIKWE